MSVPDIRGSKCKSAEVEVYLAYLRHSRGQCGWRRISEGGLQAVGQRGKRGRQICKTYQVMVRTLAFSVSGMGARLWSQQGCEANKVLEDPSDCCMENWLGKRAGMVAGSPMRKLLQQSRWEMETAHSSSSWGDEKSLDLEYILKVESTGFTKGLDVGCKGEGSRKA